MTVKSRVKWSMIVSAIILLIVASKIVVLGITKSVRVVLEIIPIALIVIFEPWPIPLIVRGVRSSSVVVLGVVLLKILLLIHILILKISLCQHGCF